MERAGETLVEWPQGDMRGDALEAVARRPEPGARQHKAPRARVHYLDWLRAGAVLGVFLFHAVHPFDTFDWHVKNAESSEILSLVIVFLFPWGLGFFFLIEGAGSYLDEVS